MQRKYELTKDSICESGHVLFRIQALISFNDVEAGNLGGYIEKEENLSHDGNAWVYDDAKVYEDAKVCNNAVIRCEANVHGHALICDEAMVFDSAQVYDYAKICDDAAVYDQAYVYGNAVVSNNGQVFGDACVLGDAEICEEAVVCHDADYMYIHGFGPECHTITAFRIADQTVVVKSEFFYGSLDEFHETVKRSFKKGKYFEEYLMIADLMRLHFKTVFYWLDY